MKDTHQRVQLYLAVGQFQLFIPCLCESVCIITLSQNLKQNLKKSLTKSKNELSFMCPCVCVLAELGDCSGHLLGSSQSSAEAHSRESDSRLQK